VVILFVLLNDNIIKVAVAEVNFPAWSKTVDLIYPRALKMTLKPRRLMVGYFTLYLGDLECMYF
jgi:hypothetical protein